MNIILLAVKLYTRGAVVLSTIAVFIRKMETVCPETRWLGLYLTLWLQGDIIAEPEERASIPLSEEPEDIKDDKVVADYEHKASEPSNESDV